MDQQSQESPREYSPEYSSPFSSNSRILEAKFNQLSQTKISYSPPMVNNKRKHHYDPTADKENNRHLPVFFDTAKSVPSMIPRVETDASGSAAGHCKAILSDFSDEQIVKTLKLNLENGHSLPQPTEQNLSNLPLQMISHQNHQQQNNNLGNFHESSSLENLSNIDKIAHQMPVLRDACTNIDRSEIYEMPSFNQSPAKVTQAARDAQEVLTYQCMKNPQVESRKSSALVDSENEEQIIRINCVKMTHRRNKKSEIEDLSQPQPAPSSHLQPFTQPSVPYAYEFPNMSVENLNVPNPHPQPSPVRIQALHNNYINADLDELDSMSPSKVPRDEYDQNPTWSSASPAAPQIIIPEQNTDSAQIHRVNPIFHREFKDPSTIQEQYTAELLMASQTATNINIGGAQTHVCSVNSNTNNQPVNMADNIVMIDDQEPTDKAPYYDYPVTTRFERSNPRGARTNTASSGESRNHQGVADQESLEQIKMLAKAVEEAKKTAATRQGRESPACDMSSSLQDFSENDIINNYQTSQNLLQTTTFEKQRQNQVQFLVPNMTNVPEQQHFSYNSLNAIPVDDNCYRDCEENEKQIHFIQTKVGQKATRHDERKVKLNKSDSSFASSSRLSKASQSYSKTKISAGTLRNQDDRSSPCMTNAQLQRFMAAEQRRSDLYQNSKLIQKNTSGNRNVTPLRKKSNGRKSPLQPLTPPKDLYKPILRQQKCGPQIKDDKKAQQPLSYQQKQRKSLDIGTSRMNIRKILEEEKVTAKTRKVTPKAQHYMMNTIGAGNQSKRESINQRLLYRTDSHLSIGASLKQTQRSSSRTANISPSNTKSTSQMKLSRQNNLRQSQKQFSTIQQAFAKPQTLAATSRQATSTSQLNTLASKRAPSPISAQKSTNRLGSSQQKSQMLKTQLQADKKSKTNRSQRMSIASGHNLGGPSRQTPSLSPMSRASAIDSKQCNPSLPFERSLRQSATISLKQQPTHKVKKSTDVSERRQLSNPRNFGQFQTLTHRRRSTSRQERTPTRNVGDGKLRPSAYQIKRCLEAIKLLDMQMFLEMERIKKPSAAVLSIAKMVCLFFEIVKDGELHEMDKVEKLVTWAQIQAFIMDNLTCKTAELKTTLAARLYSTANPIELERNPVYEDQFNLLKETFLSGSRIRVIKRFIQTSKLMRSLVSCVWSFICVFLELEVEYRPEDSLFETDKPAFSNKFDDIVYPHIPKHLLQKTREVVEMAPEPHGPQQVFYATINPADHSNSHNNINVSEVDQSSRISCSKCSCTCGPKENRSFASKKSKGKKSSKQSKIELMDSQERIQLLDQVQSNPCDQDNNSLNGIDASSIQRISRPVEFPSNQYMTLQTDRDGPSNLVYPDIYRDNFGSHTNIQTIGNEPQGLKKSATVKSRGGTPIASETQLDLSRESVRSRQLSSKMTPKMMKNVKSTPKQRASLGPTKQARLQATSRANNQTNKDLKSSLSPSQHAFQSNRSSRRQFNQTKKTNLVFQSYANSTLYQLTASSQAKKVPQQHKYMNATQTQLNPTASSQALRSQAQQSRKTKSTSCLKLTTPVKPKDKIVSSKPGKHHQQGLNKPHMANASQDLKLINHQRKSIGSRPSKPLIQTKEQQLLPTRGSLSNEQCQFQGNVTYRPEYEDSMNYNNRFGQRVFSGQEEFQPQMLVSELDRSSQQTLTPALVMSPKIHENNPLLLSQHLFVQQKDNYQQAEDRRQFILEQAQIINENINSCYKSHNMPQIDMNTIERLKLRRLQQLTGDQQQFQPCPQTPSQNTQTQQSCNILTTETIYESIPSKQANLTGQAPAMLAESSSFADALKQLKSEVASLMQKRGQQM